MIRCAKVTWSLLIEFNSVTYALVKVAHAIFVSNFAPKNVYQKSLPIKLGIPAGRVPTSKHWHSCAPREN